MASTPSAIGVWSLIALVARANAPIIANSKIARRLRICTTTLSISSSRRGSLVFVGSGVGLGVSTGDEAKGWGGGTDLSRWRTGCSSTSRRSTGCMESVFHLGELGVRPVFRHEIGADLRILDDLSEGLDFADKNIRSLGRHGIL